MNEVLCMNCLIQSFSTELGTKDKLQDVFRSGKAENKKSSANILDTSYKLQKNTQLKNQSNASFDSIGISSQFNIETGKKPNFRKLCSVVALKLGFNVNSLGTKLLIDAILFLYNNNIDDCSMEIIYNMLSQKYNVKYQKIKWSMENSMKSMRRYYDEELLYHIFPEYDGRLLNAKYIIVLGVYELREHFTPAGYTKERIEKILNSE